MRIANLGSRLSGRASGLERLQAGLPRFTAETQLKRSDALVQRYRVCAVPRITMGGRFVVVGDGIKTYGNLLVIADQLIAKARQG